MRLKDLGRQHKGVASLLFWNALVAPGVIQLKDGYLMSTLQLQGAELDGALDVELVSQAAKLNQALRRLPGGWALWTEVRRRGVRSYPEASWPDPISARLDAERRTQFTTPGAHYTNEVYVSLVWYTPGRHHSKWREWLYENLPPVNDPGTEALQYFREECQQLAGLLKGCSRGVTLLENEGLLTYLHSTISTKLHRVRVPSPPIRLAQYLADEDIQAGLFPKLGAAHVRCISPRGSLQTAAYPGELYPGILDPLMHLPVEFRATLRYLPLKRQEAVQKMSLKARRWKSQQDLAATAYAQGTQEAQALVQQGEVSEGWLTCTVVVWDMEGTILERKVARIEEVLNDAGFLAKVETLNTMAAWMGSLPGNLWANPRKDLVNSRNLAHLFPSTAPHTGQRENTHLNGPPVLMATGKGGAAVGVSLHQGDVAHTLLIGSTGDGKSTFLNALCTQHRRYKDQEIDIFDKQYAARHLTAAVGGAWYDLGVMPLQPLARLDQPYEIPWALDWLDGIYEQERLPLTPGLKEELAEGLAKVAAYDGVKRTLTTLADVLETPELKYVLRRFPQLDGSQDPLASNPWMCFEMATLLETPRVLNAVLPALFHRLEQRLTGVPTMYVLHEGWIAFDTPYWETRLRAWLKGLRTRNGWVVLATQSLADAIRARIMPALLDNVVTWICTPNAQALTDEIGQYYRAIGLNERERELLTLGTKKQDYYLKQATGSGMIQLDLGPVGMAVCGTPMTEELPHIEALIAQHGAGFADVYLREKGIAV